MSQELEKPRSGNKTSLAPLGVMLVSVSILAAIALLHHPVAHGYDERTLLASLKSQVTLDRLVHGVMIIVYELLTLGMFVFALRLGAARFPVLLGLIAFSCASVMIVLAALTDGFIAPAIVERCALASAPCSANASVLLSFGALQIEYLTRFAFVAIGFAVLGWSVALLSTSGAPRWSGAAGLIAGVFQLTALMLSPERLTPHSLLFITAGQLAWYLVVGTLMILGRRPFDQ